MSKALLWGTGLAPAAFSLRRRVTTDGFLRVTTDGFVRVAYVQAPQVRNVRVTTDGFRRVTTDGFRRVTILGLQGPQYFQSANVTSDGGETFAFRYMSGPWQPTPQGGENLFRWAYLTLSWSMAATVRASAFVDGGNGFVPFTDGSTLTNVPSTFLLDQQTGTLQRKSQVFAVPLARRLVRPSGAVGRWYLRGERFQLLIESTGPLGVGELMLDGIQVDAGPLRKAQYASVDSTP